MFGVKLSQGTIENTLKRSVRGLGDFEVAAKAALVDSGVVHFDETGMRVKQKVSGCFRSPEGAQRFALLRSYVMTAKKQGMNILEAFVGARKGNPFIPESP